ncbi:MAG TPA: serine/threonine-protein kinase, partial [Kofleriaceae bacterium]|nr:serine/threonine-protein kinase [Kofleriaceae bacterium]
MLETLDERLALLPRVLAVCEAIAFAHNERIIHRDLKPANVMLGSFGEAYVVDWGLAKSLDGPAEPELPIATDGDGLTHMGSVLGTPPYLPPEQARGEPVDERADVYALGALLYQVLLGKQPYDRGVGPALDRVLAGPPDPLAEREPGVPPELVAIVDTAMARDQVDRYANAGELAADLRRFLTGQLVGAHRYSTRRLIARWVRRHRAVVIAAVVAIVAITAIGAYSFSRVVDERDTEARRTSELYVMQARHALDVDPTASIAWLKRHAAGIAPDALAIREIGIDAASRGIASEVVRGFAGTDIADDGTVAGTDDQHRVAVARAGARVEVVSAAIPASPIAIDRRARWVAWSQPDIQIYDLAARTTRTIAPAVGERPTALRFVGDRLAIGDPDGNVRLVAITTGEIRVLAGHHAPIYDLTASKDGAWVASAARDASLWLWATDTGKGRQLPADALASSVSMSATRMAWGGGHVTVRWIDFATDAIHVGPTLTGANVVVALSPDGHHLATSDETAVHDDDLDTGEHRTFAAHTDWVDHLAFSTDGNTLVSSQSHGGPVIAWDVAASSSGDPHPLLGHDHTIEAMRFVGDGTLVVVDRSELRRWVLPPRRSHVVSAHTLEWPEIAALASGGFVAVVGDGEAVFASATPHPIAPAVALVAPFAVSGDAVAFADRDGRLWLWTGGDDAKLVGHGVVARDVAFDGTRIAVGGIDGTIEVWTPGHPEPMRFSGHAGPVISVRFDGGRLVSAGDDASLRTWDLATGATKVLSDGGAGIE